MELSLVASFDELKRCQDVLTDGTAEIEFRRFLPVIEASRLQWQATTAEAQRLQRELDKCAQERSDFETKLFHARRLLETESKARRAAEIERDNLEKKLSRACEFLHADRAIDDETRSKLAFLNMSTRKRKSKSNRYADRCGNEIDSTGSFLSDLSVTQSEEDFLEMSKPFKKHRPSTTAAASTTYGEPKHMRRSARRSMDLRNKKNTSVIDLDGSEKIVATTKVSIPQGDGPIEATSTIEAVPSSGLYNQFDRIDIAEQPYERVEKDTKKPTEPLVTPQRHSMKFQQEYPMPSAPPLQEVTNNPKLLLNLQGRQHEFSSRVLIRSEVCAQCDKKFRFGASALKCRLCSNHLHQDCKMLYTKPCIPKSQGTPNFKNGKQGYINEYVPAGSPMIPPLIVHCVNEIETRGLSEEGIYRVSGSEKEIKALKERFMRGKSLPNLSSYDIHVVCGCIKDFLRGLREPLIPTNLWKNFSNAVQTVEEASAVRNLFAAINQLPQANRDTLAFLVMHLQRVAECEAIKMHTDNLAKIFGPTVLGYSSADPDQHTIFTETMIQKDVMLHLLEIPTDYWAHFINVESTDTDSQKVSGYSYFGTPNARLGNTTMRKERKFFATPPNATRR